MQLTLHNRTISRFIADDKVVYWRVRRQMWLASNNSRAGHRLKHLSWRSRWIILCTLERRMAVSCEISRADRCLFGLSSWLSTSRPLLRDELGLPLPGSQTIVPVLQILFSRLSMLLSFRPLSGNSLNSLHALYCFARYIFLIRIITSSCEIFMIIFLKLLLIFRSWQFPR